MTDFNVEQYIISLIGVLALAMFCGYLIKRYKRDGSSGNDRISLLSTLSLGQKEKIMLISVDNQRILLGATSQSINPLFVLSEKMITKKANTLESSNDSENEELLKPILDEEFENYFKDELKEIVP